MKTSSILYICSDTNVIKRILPEYHHNDKSLLYKTVEVSKYGSSHLHDIVALVSYRKSTSSPGLQQGESVPTGGDRSEVPVHHDVSAPSHEHCVLSSPGQEVKLSL